MCPVIFVTDVTGSDHTIQTPSAGEGADRSKLKNLCLD